MEKKTNEKEVETNEKEVEIIKVGSDNKVIIVLLLLIIIIMFVFILLLVTNRVNIPINNQPTNNTPNYTVDENITNNETNSNKPENIYKIEYKEETKEFKNSSGKSVIINKRNYPIVTNDANSTAASKITELLKKESDEEWNELNNTYYTTEKEFIENLPYEVGVTETFNVEESNNKYLTFKYVMTGSMGGVGWYGTAGYSFDYETGNKLTINDIMDYNSHKDELYEFIISDIEKKHNPETLWNDNVSGYWKNIVKENMFKEDNWILTNSGINVFFEKYSLGPGAVGYVIVEIPASKINNYLYDKYKY